MRPEYSEYSELEKLNKRIVLFYALLDTLSRPVLLSGGAGLTFLFRTLTIKYPHIRYIPTAVRHGANPQEFLQKEVTKNSYTDRIS